jgi:protein O-mannosyl-transferase
MRMKSLLWVIFMRKKRIPADRDMNADVPRRQLSVPLQMLGVFVVGAILYGHTLSVPWYMDDGSFTQNVDNLDLWRALSALFTQRGLTRLTFALNYWAGGLNPVGFHLVNIAIHLASSSLVLLLLLRVFPRRRWYPLLGTLLFVAHPLQTQAVTYTVQRLTSLAGLLFLLALYLFVRARELLAAGAAFRTVRHLGCYLGALLAGALAILAKENAVLLPFALLLFARFFPAGTDTRWRPLLAYVVPFCLAPIWSGVSFVIPLLSGSTTLDKIANSSGLANMEGNSPLRYLFTEFSVLWIYIRMLFLPYGQALDHGYPVSVELLTLKSGVGLLGLAALLFLAIRLRHRQPAISAGILWFFLTLAVESSLIPLDPLFEHRLYLPIFGFAMLVPALVDFVPRPAVRYGMLVLFLLVMALLTWRRNALWKDPVAFYEDNLQLAPHNERLCNNLAVLYMENANSLEKAKSLLESCLQSSPNNVDTQLNLANTLLMMGKKAEAEEEFRRILQFNPHFSDAYVGMGTLFMSQGRLDEAFTYLQRALQENPNSAKAQGKLLEAYMNHGNALDDQGNTAEALAEYSKALAISANNELLHYNLAMALEKAGDRQKANEHYREALRLKPTFSEARLRLEKNL